VLADDLGEHVEVRRDRRSACACRSNRAPAFSAISPRLDVQVVEDLQVVGDEAGGAHDHGRPARASPSSSITDSIGGPHHGSFVRPALCHAIR
jgi:hypothetical protein